MEFSSCTLLSCDKPGNIQFALVIVLVILMYLVLIVDFDFRSRR